VDAFGVVIVHQAKRRMRTAKSRGSGAAMLALSLRSNPLVTVTQLLTGEIAI
jgi:hypothetical protein